MMEIALNMALALSCVAICVLAIGKYRYENGLSQQHSS